MRPQPRIRVEPGTGGVRVYYDGIGMTSADTSTVWTNTGGTVARRAHEAAGSHPRWQVPAAKRRRASAGTVGGTCSTASEAAPLTAKSVGTPNGPCGFLSASSRRDSRSGMADRRHPLRRIGRPKPKPPSLCHPSWLVRRSKRLCGSGRVERYALLRTWLKCQSARDQGALVSSPSGLVEGDNDGQRQEARGAAPAGR